MVKGILDIITPPTKIKKTVYAQTYTRINTYYLYLLLILISIKKDLDTKLSGFFLALKIILDIVYPMFSWIIAIDFLSKIVIKKDIFIKYWKQADAHRWCI